jgi:hypothetical protein
VLRHLGREDATDAASDALRVAPATPRRRAGRFFGAALALLLLGCSSGKSGPLGAASTPPHPETGPETDCAGCHPSHVEEWRASSHAYAMKDPVFGAMVELGQQETKGVLDDFCVKCHSPIGNATGQTAVVRDAATGVYSQPTAGLDTAAMDGVSCLVCHSMTQVKSVANADFEMTLDDVRHGPIRDPDPSSVHRTEYSGLYQDTPICGTCHVVVNPKNVALERTHIEWVDSAFNGSKSCQDCHMPSYEGPAAVGHRTRTVHEHRFVGVDVSLLPASEFPGYDDRRARADELLKGAARFTVAQTPGAPQLDVDIENLAGHALPSGATADRELWVELVVRDSAGSTVLESGTLDERGDLRVDDPERTTRPGTDPALVLYTQEMFEDPKLDDPTSTDPPHHVDFLWQPNRESSHLILAGETAHRNYDLGSLPPGTYAASARLLFRTFPPHLFRKLTDAGSALDPSVSTRVPTVEMAAESVNLTLE